VTHFDLRSQIRFARHEQFNIQTNQAVNKLYEEYQIRISYT